MRGRGWELSGTPNLAEKILRPGDSLESAVYGRTFLNLALQNRRDSAHLCFYILSFTQLVPQHAISVERVSSVHTCVSDTLLSRTRLQGR